VIGDREKKTKKFGVCKKGERRHYSTSVARTSPFVDTEVDYLCDGLIRPWELPRSVPTYLLHSIYLRTYWYKHPIYSIGDRVDVDELRSRGQGNQWGSP
jgi:hypothetical protein